MKNVLKSILVAVVVMGSVSVPAQADWFQDIGWNDFWHTTFNGDLTPAIDQIKDDLDAIGTALDPRYSGWNEFFGTTLNPTNTGWNDFWFQCEDPNKTIGDCVGTVFAGVGAVIAAPVLITGVTIAAISAMPVATTVLGVSAAPISFTFSGSLA